MREAASMGAYIRSLALVIVGETSLGSIMKKKFSQNFLTSLNIISFVLLYFWIKPQHPYISMAQITLRCCPVVRLY
jgi:hypothetical protein